MVILLRREERSEDRNMIYILYIVNVVTLHWNMIGENKITVAIHVQHR